MLPIHLSIILWYLYVLVQELLAVSVISFRGVMAQHFGCSLILQELSAFFNVFRGVHHHYAGALSAGLMVYVGVLFIQSNMLLAGLQQLDYYATTCTRKVAIIS